MTDPNPARKLTVHHTGFGDRAEWWQVRDSTAHPDCVMMDFATKEDAEQFAASDTILREHAAMREVLKRIEANKAGLSRVSLSELAREVLATLETNPGAPHDH